MRRRSKLAVLACAAVGAITALITTFLYVTSHETAERNEQAKMTLVDDLLRASQAQVALEKMSTLSRAYVLSHEPGLSARTHGSLTELQGLLRHLEGRAGAMGESPLFDSVLVSADRYGEALQHFLDDGTSSHAGVAAAGGRGFVSARDRLRSDLKDLVARREHQIYELHAATRDLAARIVPVIVGICAVGLLVGLLFARSVFRTIDEAVIACEYPLTPPWEEEEPAANIPVPARTAKIIDFKSIQVLPERSTVLRFPRPTDDGAEPR